MPNQRTAVDAEARISWSAGGAPLFQSHWRRFAVTIAMSAASCALMLSGFAEILISARPAPPSHTSAVVVKLVETAKPPAKPISAAPVLHAAPALRPAPRPLPRRRKRVAAAPPRLTKERSRHDETRSVPASAVGSVETNRGGVPKGGEPKASPHGPSAAGGTETAGARALYAPAPEIPDDLREEVFSALAVAHFFVDREGHVQVTLVKATSNPRLNQIILDSLRTWKFLPAMKDGVAVNSEFDLRIPIAVQ